MKVQIPGTCGELVQGKIAEQNFLISLPVNKYSKVRVVLNDTGIIAVKPCWCTKVKIAVEKTLHFYGAGKLGAEILVESDLPIGKGWASSSADIFAAIEGVAFALNKKLSKDELAQLALTIEPTDGIFLPGLAIFDHVHGTKLEILGAALPFQVVACEFAETVDTLSFNKRPDLTALNRAKESQIIDALELVKQGVKDRDSKKVAEGATISAIAHQQILFKPFLNKILDMALSFGALGVNIAHSGTTIGILFNQDTPIDSRLIASLISHIPGIQQVHQLQAICGGIKVLTKDY